jgi:DNA anti-recombination protein RmuC
MPTTLPPSVREHFGEAVAEDFARWLDEYVQGNAVERDEYREVLSRLDVLEEGLNHMDKRFDLLTEHVDERIDHVEETFEARLTGMEERFEERFEQIDQRFEQIDQRFESMEARFDQRFESMEARFDQRFESMEARFDSRLVEMREEFNDRFESMDAKLDRMNDRILSMTRWLIGLVALFGSLVTALLAVAQFG